MTRGCGAMMMGWAATSGGGAGAPLPLPLPNPKGRWLAERSSRFASTGEPATMKKSVSDVEVVLSG